MPLVIGVDSSTQSTKAELRDVGTGALVATGRSTHPATAPPVSEQHPDSWWNALIDAVDQLGDRRSEVVAISVGGQQHGLVLVDGAGTVVRPAKLWNDTTSAPQAERLAAELGAKWWADWTGIVPVASFTITKLAWVVDNEPERLGEIERIMLPHDWLTWRLSGEHVTDRGDASGTGWFDATADRLLAEPFEKVFGHADEWVARLPRVLGPVEAAGTIRAEAAEQLGLPTATVVGAGTGDNMAAALGLGLAAGDVVVSLGTSGTVFTRAAERANDPSGTVAGFCDATGEYLPLVCTLNATKVTDTVASWIGATAEQFARLALTDLAPSETMLVPYFDGERTPNRPDARGVFVGLSNTTDRAQLARAAHDGVVCGLLDGMMALAESGAAVDGRLLLVGGGARSAAYRQRLADIAERVVEVPANQEAVAAGAAVQAAVAARIDDRSLDTVASDWALDRAEPIDPRPGADGTEIRARYADARSFDDGLCRPLGASA